MFIAGSLLALFCGVANSAAAALEKQEGMRADPEVTGLRLLAVLVRRSRWLVAMVLSAAAWVAEAASLALAPVAVVATLRDGGRGLLVAAGWRWLGERFSRLELAAVALATAGSVATAVGSAGGAVVRTPLSNLDEVVVAGTVAVAVTIVSGHHRRPPAATSGVALGAAVGLLFVATGVFTKEIGDRFALHGFPAVFSLAASPGPWVMIAFSVWAQNLLQGAFRKANAASVAAANATVASMGLVAAGYLLYGEPFPSGSLAVVLVAGIITSAIGTTLLATSARRDEPTSPNPP